MRKNKRIRENINILRKITSEEKYLYFLKHYDKKDTLKTHILQITIYDKLDNHGMNLLMKQIHRLKKNKKYSVNAYYKKPGKTELDYVHGNLEGWSTFSIAEIKINGDKWISSIDVAGTNITNSEILIEYTFHLTDNTVSAHFKDLYRKNLDYLQAISTTRDNKIIYFITIISLVVALIGLFISLWPVIKPESPNVINKNYNIYQYNDNRKTNENKFSIFN